MSEAGQNSTGKPGSDIEQLLVNIQNLDAESKKDFVARSMKQVLQDPELLAQAVNSIENVEAKKAAATSAVESAQDGEEGQVVAQAVRSTSTLEGKKAAATSAVESAQDGEEEQVVAQAVRSTSTLEGKKAAATSAVESAQDGEEGQVAAQAVRSTSTLEGKKAAATSAVESAQDGGKKEVATAAVKAAHDPTTQEEILAELQSTLVELPKMIGQMIAWCLVIIAVVGVLILFMSVQGELGAASLLVTISIAVVSTLAGYCLGAASLVTEKLKKRPDLKGLVGKGINSRE